LEKFKENIMDLQGKDTIIKKYEKINTAIKTALTKKYNSINKTSIKRKKIKLKGDPIIKYDEDGNILEEILSEEEDEENSSETIESINGTAKGKKK
jgi:hypothetical protein